ncbi:uncharacterized protein LOC133310979 [Gastrolobium bilobum]|uniref:uncharacterized protein LOC133310979 n=1 Tax=Gastrolobium bilobum TaxID=150636 RepID=UPI002AB1FD67|nr:uncharacterized protein LOC133310979 [Gastrolobium bilobum]
MNFLVWNCRGAAKKTFRTSLSNFTRKHKIDLVAILEPRISGATAQKKIKQLGFNRFELEEAVGFSGGIWILWKDELVEIEFIEKNSQFIHMAVSNNAGSNFLLTVVYANPREDIREELWPNLMRISNNVNDWRTAFEDAEIRALPRLNSDHNPLLLSLAPKESLQELVNPLKSWNKRVFGCIQLRKDFLLKKLQEIQRNTNHLLDHFNSDLDKALQEELNRVLLQEEAIWFQKARCNWIKDGDRNTKFYHTTTIIRRARNKILELKNDEGHFVREEENLKKLILGFFNNLFAKENVQRPWVDTNFNWPVLLEAEKKLLNDPISDMLIKEAFFSMGSLKAPGPDCFPALFFQHNWELLKNQVVMCVNQIWNNPADVRDLNKTFLVLTPKLKNPEKISQFRPIALCFVLYKGISKIIVGKLKPVLTKLISPQQVSFVPGRHIQDNIAIAQEMVHSMNRKKGKRGFFTIKIDLEKAYDRMSWSFIHKVLIEINLPDQLVNLIMLCISTTELDILWNGTKSGRISPSRGLRQGDPISPYIFVLCMEKLSHLIADCINDNVWKPMKAGKGGPSISHLLFADDLLLFGEANISQINTVMNCLSKFSDMSGQKVSYPKSNIFFSKNVSPELANAIVEISGFAHTRNIGRYLGYKMKHGRVSKQHYGEIMDRVDGRLQGWKKSCLLMAGRVTLAKSVISAIPSFHMQSSLLPKGICDDIEKIQRSFIWGESENQRKFHAVSWEQLKMGKSQGGLGVINLRRQNEAFLHKCVWRLINSPDQLWAQVLGAKYGRRKDLLKEAVSKPYDSHLWKSLCKIWPDMTRNLSWQIGNGKQVDFWMDDWVGCKASLLSLAINPPTADTVNCKVNHSMFSSEAGWNVPFLMHHFDSSIVNQIMAIPHPDGEAGEDFVCWRNTIPGQSLVKTAYNNLSNLNPDLSVNSWDRIWSWKGKERVKVFMWRMYHGRMLTKDFISKWSGSSNCCPSCPEDVETNLHAFRDCVKAKKVWYLPLFQPLPLGFFSMVCFKEWISLNLIVRKTRVQDWRDLFFIACNFLWYWRNKELHDGSAKRPEDPSLDLLELVRESGCCRKLKLQFENMSPYIEPSTVWNAPSQAFLKLNVDGAVSFEKAACGGLLRDWKGNWICGFTAFIGNCSSLQAELWAIFHGLNFVWNSGWKNIILESDSSQAIGLLTSSGNDSRKLPLVTKIRAALNKDWSVLLKHIPRTCNFCADWLAKKALDDPFGVTTFSSPHFELLNLLAADMLDPGSSRLAASR